MPGIALWHRLHTNAVTNARWETTGAHGVPVERDAAQVLPPEALYDLDDLLKKISPSDDRPGYAVRRYSAGADALVCVVVSYGRLVSDSGGRGGRLNHARVVKVPANKSLFDVAALVDAAETFAVEAVERAPVDGRLAAYLDFVAGESTVNVRAVTLEELRELPRSFLCSMLAACLSVHGRRERARFVLPQPEDGSLAMAVARGWAALPVALQRGGSWAVDVDDGCPVDVMLSATAGRRAADAVKPQVAESVNRYVNLLLEGPQELSAILRNPEVVTLGRLHDAVQQVQTMDMKKGRANEPAGGTNRPADAAELDRQYKALELSLKAYIDQRMDALDPRQPRGAAAIDETVYEQARPRVVPAGAPVPWKPWLIGGVLAVLAVAFGVWWFFGRDRQPVQTAQQAAGTTQAEVTATAPVQTSGGGARPDNRSRDALKAAIAAATADGKWAQSFKDLIEKHGALVSAKMRDAANGDDLDGDVVTSEARDDLFEMASRIDAKEALTSGDREKIRELLIDYTAALAARDEPRTNVSVDGNLRDVTADLLRRLKTNHLTVTKSTDKTNMELQSEIVLRWLETASR